MQTQESTQDAQGFVGREQDLGLGPDPVSPTLIRYWCEAFEDSNPLYWRGLGAGGQVPDQVAPPALAASVCRLPYWPVDPEVDQRGLIGEVGDGLGRPESVVRTVSWDFHRPLRVGDRVRCIERVLSVSPEKHTRIGPGYFVTLAREYVDEVGAPISTASLDFFKYARSGGAPRPVSVTDPGDAPPTRSPRARSGLTPPLAVDASTLRVGTELPPLEWALHGTRMVQMAYISRDFNPVHHDAEYARANGLEHMFMQWACYAGVFGRYVGHVLGPDPEVRNVMFRMNRPLYAGRTMSVTGEVSEVRTVPDADGATDLTLALAVSDGTGVTAPATVRVRL